ncbi:Caln1 [Symbiodinium natans]|uniref:Caln1 protein n=1 Tax=Symbiodinium natans TaxID=878477 RepID=A0A812SB86_9DINO|nr:Caln1 [Symbiodinium natans]
MLRWFATSPGASRGLPSRRRSIARRLPERTARRAVLGWSRLQHERRHQQLLRQFVHPPAHVGRLPEGKRHNKNYDAHNPDNPNQHDKNNHDSNSTKFPGGCCSSRLGTSLPEVWSVSGPCTVNGDCVESPNYPAADWTMKLCKISLPRAHVFHVREFRAGNGFLRLDDSGYSGQDLAVGSSVAVQSSIDWEPSGHYDAAWRLCLSEAGSNPGSNPGSTHDGLPMALIICVTVLSTAALLVPPLCCIARARKADKEETAGVEAVDQPTPSQEGFPGSGNPEAGPIPREQLDDAMRAVVASAAFDALDLNGDGTISRTEFAAHCAAKGVAPATAAAAFATLDLDADGIITQQEFACHVLQSGLAHPHIECQGTWLMDLPSGRRTTGTVAGAQVSCSGEAFVLQGDQDRTFFQLQDGVFQELTAADDNALVWRTCGAWPQTLRWTRIPSCPKAQGCADVQVLSTSTGYECSGCGQEQLTRSCWFCPSHDAFLCPECAPVPTDAVLGISAAWVIDTFPGLARKATGMANPNFHEICPAVAMGPQGLGFGKACPRDGRPGCSVVDAVDDKYRGRATHFVSWCWTYSLDDFVSALQSWVAKEQLNAGEVYLWVCFFCNNQYRMLESGTQTGSDELKAVFESHLGEAGRMLLMLDSFVDPKYITRAWCIFESFVCIDKKFAMTIILPESSGAKFKQTLDSAGGFSKLQEAFEAMDVRYAEASSKADEDKADPYNHGLRHGEWRRQEPPAEMAHGRVPEASAEPGGEVTHLPKIAFAPPRIHCLGPRVGPYSLSLG